MQNFKKLSTFTKGINSTGFLYFRLKDTVSLQIVSCVILQGHRQKWKGMKKNVSAMVLAVLVFVGCQPANTDWKSRADQPEWLHRSVQQLTEVIVHDIFSPPVASRIYAYPSIAAYEVMAQDDTSWLSLAGQLRELTPVPAPTDPDKPWCAQLAALEAFLQTGKKLVFSEYSVETFRDSLFEEIKLETGMPQAVYDRSLAYGQQVAAHILNWAGNDNYKQTRTSPKFSITSEPGRWKPTPPDYMEGIEPSWRMIRPFAIDSAQQFKPLPPPEFSMKPGSPFYAMTMEVYDSVRQLAEEGREIASFWDCNPYVSTHKGHFMFATKKITPGGHWMGITGIASGINGDSFAEAARTGAMVSISLFDAFISCWDEKYRSNLIRPETVINEFIDPEWKPVLQTPPFPEHTSGHSVISASAATALTSIYGEPFAFTDTVEVAYGLPARQFNSFRDAADEAAISRLYGGIHYRPAIEYGVDQGKQVGQLIVERIQFRKDD